MFRVYIQQMRQSRCQQKFQKSMEHDLSSAELRMKEYLPVRGTFEVAEGPEKVQVLLNGRKIGSRVSLN